MGTLYTWVGGIALKRFYICLCQHLQMAQSQFFFCWYFWDQVDLTNLNLIQMQAYNGKFLGRFFFHLKLRSKQTSFLSVSLNW